MKIAIYHNLPSGGAKRGLHGFVRELSNRGHYLAEIRLSTADAGFMSVARFVSTERVVPFQPRHRFAYRIPLLATCVDTALQVDTLRRLDRLSRELAQEIESKEYDLVFVHDCAISLKPLLLRHLSLPSAFYCHHSARGKDYAFKFHNVDVSDSSQPIRLGAKLHSFAQRLYWSAFSWLEWRSARAATQVLTNSFFSRESYFRDFGVSAQVVPYGIDCSTFHPVSNDRGNYVLAVGEVGYRKGYRFLVRALSLIPAAMRPRLVILANGTDPAEHQLVTQLAARLGVQLDAHRVTDHNRLLEYYSRAQLFVYTPIMEAFGLAPLEAMACCTPVVAVREGGPRESIVDGETGILVDRDEEAFAKAVAHLVARPKLCNSMGQAGREHVMRRWTWEAAGDSLEKCLRRVVQEEMSNSGLL